MSTDPKDLVRQMKKKAKKGGENAEITGSEDPENGEVQEKPTDRQLKVVTEPEYRLMARVHAPPRDTLLQDEGQDEPKPYGPEALEDAEISDLDYGALAKLAGKIEQVVFRHQGSEITHEEAMEDGVIIVDCLKEDDEIREFLEENLDWIDCKASLAVHLWDRFEQGKDRFKMKHPEAVVPSQGNPLMAIAPVIAPGPGRPPGQDHPSDDSHIFGVSDQEMFE